MGDNRLEGSGSEVFDPPRFALSTVVYAQRSNGQILLLQRAEGSAMAGQYFLPGGVVDEGENPYEGARRELREEAGLDAQGKFTIIGSYPLWVYGRDFLMLSFHTTVPDAVELSHEHDDFRWVDPTKFAATFTEELILEIAAGDERVDAMLRAIRDDANRFLAYCEP